MPHLVIERRRSLPNINKYFASAKESSKVKDRNVNPVSPYLIEAGDIVSALVFIAGSVCFLPDLADGTYILAWGCVYFIIGSIFYCLICAVTLEEAIRKCGALSSEAAENALYLGGSFIWLVGTFYYWPLSIMEAHPHLEGQEHKVLNKLLLSVYKHAHVGTWLFIIGSVMFVVAGLLNLMRGSKSRFNDWATSMLYVVASLYLLGSLLFLAGSIAILPCIAGSYIAEETGALCFIIGSVIFLVASVLSLWRTHYVLTSREDEECAPLYDSDADDELSQSCPVRPRSFERSKSCFAKL